MTSFYKSIDLDNDIQIRVAAPEIPIKHSNASELIETPHKKLSFKGTSDPIPFVIEAQVYTNSLPLGLPVKTKYKQPTANNRPGSQKWNEWLTLPVKIQDLLLDSSILITIWGPSGLPTPEIFASCKLPLFSDSKLLLQGRHKLTAYLNQDPRELILKPNRTYVKEVDKIEKLIKSYQIGQIKPNDWLDNLAFRKIEYLTATAPPPPEQNPEIYVELPIWDHDIVYLDKKYPQKPSSLLFSNSQQLATSVALLELSDKDESDIDNDTLMAVYDPDFGTESPIESKYRRLVRLANIDRDIRPTAKVRDELEKIISYSPVHELSSNDKILLWKYRFYLTKWKHALTKFVKSVSWDDEVESHQAIEVMHLWATIDVADALELLGPEIRNAQVRAYAVDRLRKASDHDLELYLLQLVEALKFEPWQQSAAKSYLSRFLANRAVLNPNLGNFFYWYVSVQASDRKYGSLVYQPILKHYLVSLPQKPIHVSKLRQETENDLDQPELDADAEALTLRQVKLQVRFMNKLLDLAKLMKQSKEPRPKKIELLRAYISDPKHDLLKFTETILPLDPSVSVVGCVPEECTMFKSTMVPLKITLDTSTGGKYSLIFKNGDDLRQDQLVMQIIQLMDQLLKNENLDLKLTPYRILATSMTDGAIQFIPNEPISNVLSEYHGILPFLRQHADDPQEQLGVNKTVMENFVRSTAGYAVITYLLGVGDRHLDNLLIDHEGHFFHIDFGYILGKDPKPFPPMIKLPIQLIDGMGGINSENYTRFKSYCFTAFITLRKSANLILALFNLMTESTIPSIILDKEQTVQKVEERFCLEMNEEEAILHFQTLINDSVNAFMPIVIDRLHSLAQYWRA